MDPGRALQRILWSLRLRKARALLLFLAVERGPHRAEKIFDLFWSDVEPLKASMSFRQTVRQLRLSILHLPGASIETVMGAIALRRYADVPFIAGLVRGLCAPDWDSAVAGEAKTLMEMLESLEGISGSFDSWLAIQRALLIAETRRALDGFLTRPDHFLTLPDHAASRTAHEAAEFALQIEPANEVAVRFVMRMHWQSGRHTRALQAYNDLYHHLDAEFDQEPEADTVSLLAAIKLNPEQAPVPGALPEAQPKATIAVRMDMQMPLLRGNESLAAVLLADLRMRLARFREWRLTQDPGPVVPHVLVALRPVEMGGRLQLFVELQRFPGGDLLWSEVIKSPETDWERKVRQLLANIANALTVVIANRSPAETGTAVYDKWLQSQVLLDSWSAENEHKAIGILRQITRDAPRFGAAHAELAGALNVRHVLLPGTTQNEEVKQSALHHAIEAVSIDPLDTRAHRVLAWCYCHKAEFELAEFHFDQSLTLNRSNPLTLASCALGFAFTGGLDRAAALVDETKQHAHVMEPFHLIYLAAADYLLGNFAAAAGECASGAGLMATVGGWHSAALWQLGERDAAAQRLAGFGHEIAAQWHGPGTPDLAAVTGWFVSVFPLRHAPVRQELRATLQAVARHSSGQIRLPSPREGGFPSI